MVLLLILLLCGGLPAAGQFISQLEPIAGTLWPLPQHFDPGTTLLPIDTAGLVVSTAVARQGAAKKGSVLSKGIERFKSTLLPPGGGNAAPAGGVKELRIIVGSANDTLALGVDEGYNLTVSAPRAELRAATVWGALYGLETFSQLIEVNGPGSAHAGECSSRGACFQAPFAILNATIRDWPRFPWRGLMLETGSHFYPVPLLRRMIDAMAANKLNALHWSLWDSASVPFASASLPNLSTAAYTPSATYTHADIKGLQDYARDRGVRLVPQLPQPAHVSALCMALPLCCGRGGRGGILDPSNPNVLSAFKALFAETAALFDDQFVHIADDEAHYLYGDWNKSTSVQTFMKEKAIDSLPALETWLEKQLAEAVLATGKTPIVWESHTNFLAAQPGPGGVDSRSWMTDTFPTAQTIATSYISGDASTSFLLNAGYQVLFATDVWYLDYDDGSQRTTPWEYFRIDPVPQNLTGSPLAERILGGQASMWAANADAVNLEAVVWPKTCAVAERLWSAPLNRTGLGPARGWTPASDVKGRLTSQACRMQQRGIGSGPYGEGYCCPRPQAVKTDDLVRLEEPDVSFDLRSAAARPVTHEAIGLLNNLPQDANGPMPVLRPLAIRNYRGLGSLDDYRVLAELGTVRHSQVLLFMEWCWYWSPGNATVRCNAEHMPGASGNWSSWEEHLRGVVLRKQALRRQTPTGPQIWWDIWSASHWASVTGPACSFAL